MGIELEKMLAGEIYDPSAPELVALRRRARRLTRRYNDTLDTDPEERALILRELLGTYSPGVWIEPPFHCDYGINIHLGPNVFVNMGCVILDSAEVRIGEFVQLAPGVQIYTSSHAMHAAERRAGPELAKPVTIGADVRLGGGVIVSPGVTIGERTVIGAGSVIREDVPPDVLAAGNPATILQPIRNND